MGAAGRSPGRDQTPPGLPSPSSSLVIFIPSQKKNPPGWALGPAPGGSHESWSSGLSGSAQVRSASLLGKLVLVDRKLLEARSSDRVGGQLAAGGGDELGEHGAVDVVRDIMDGTIAHHHVEPARMAAVDIREPSLLGSAETVPDILVGPQRVGESPISSVDLAAGRVRRAEVGAVAGAGFRG